MVILLLDLEDAGVYSAACLDELAGRKGLGLELFKLRRYSDSRRSTQRFSLSSSSRDLRGGVGDLRKLRPEPVKIKHLVH